MAIWPYEYMTPLAKALSSTMILTISSVSEKASLILMLHVVVWCGNFPCGAVIALPPGDGTVS